MADQNMLNEMEKIRSEALRFIHQRATERTGEYNYSATGGANLYSSCYALMSRYYLGDLALSEEQRAEWIEYINSWQMPDGSYLGPELRAQLPVGAKHDLEHLAMHLTITVLPCLDLLGANTKYPVNFAHKFLDPNKLQDWLDARNWQDAWLEGNNILFVLQLLLHLRDVEAIPSASVAIEQVMSWLDANADPRTGLWGTFEGMSSNFNAMCGGYHQLLVYFYMGRAINYPSALAGTTLALQHADGGFSPNGGGGACEDVDAVDILVNLYKRHDYRRPEIRFSLRRAFDLIKRQQMPDGGFVYRRDEEFSHMGMALTKTPPNMSNMFATWFRLHTIALIAEVLLKNGAIQSGWKFNRSVSMGWHDTSISSFPRGSNLPEYVSELYTVGFKAWITWILGYSRILRLRHIVWAGHRTLRRFGLFS